MDAIQYSKLPKCIRTLRKLGLDLDKSKEICTLILGEQYEDVKPSDACVSAKIHIFHTEHPDWDHDHVTAAAINYCKEHGNVHDIETVSNVQKIGSREQGSPNKTPSISGGRFTRLVKLIRTNLGLKVGGMGLLPLQIALPMKNINKLQTKFERMVTAESKPEAMTQEELARRRQYAQFMKKDADFQDVNEEEALLELVEDINKAIEILRAAGISEDEIENIIYTSFLPLEIKDYYFQEDAELFKPNSSLNNIIKAPIILAKEIVQKYIFRNTDGKFKEEFHFKPYEELKNSIKGIERLWMIIEHKDSWGDLDTVGYVSNLIADDSLRAIRGMGYFIRGKCPQELIQLLDEGKTVGVSIGFKAELGESGEFSGKKYDHVQRNIELNHLAITLQSIPRCPLPLCGVNTISVKPTEISQDSANFTIISKGNYYYDIEDLIIDLEETSLGKDSSTSKGDSMTNMPENGKIGWESKDFEVFLDYLRKFMLGESETVKESAKAKIKEILHMTDLTEIKKDGDVIINEKEFKDTITAKDAEIEKLNKENAELKEFAKDSMIKEIKAFSDKYSDEELKKSCIHDLKTIKDAVSRYHLPEKKPEVIPVKGKDADLKKEKEEGKKERVNPREVFADISKEFDMSEFGK